MPHPFARVPAQGVDDAGDVAPLASARAESGGAPTTGPSAALPKAAAVPAVAMTFAAAAFAVPSPPPSHEASRGRAFARIVQYASGRLPE